MKCRLKIESRHHQFNFHIFFIQATVDEELIRFHGIRHLLRRDERQQETQSAQ